MIHIAEARICVLDLTGWARQEARPIRTLGFSHVFYTSLVRSISHCSPIGGHKPSQLMNSHCSEQEHGWGQTDVFSTTITVYFNNI
ncbi:unnamed protein product [Schistosoma margrebowiei]|uniref:Uncharacterized protein n=1 Tax=Schistosoma margrebowiei TaxID=48269 RepID=A0A183LJ23_9TREM|nr:unnamed protein product [Schistosoma margrebowiei]